jgi:hypothetical protein
MLGAGCWALPPPGLTCAARTPADRPAGGSELRSRAEVAATREAKAAARAAAAQERGDRFEAAVQKANWASQMLRNQGAGGDGGGGDGGGGDALDPDADDELAASLERARRLALAREPAGGKSLEGVRGWGGLGGCWGLGAV